MFSFSFQRFYNYRCCGSCKEVLFCDQSLTAAAAAAKLLQSCPTLCDPIHGSPPGSPVPGILQARTLEWVAISFSNAWKWKVKVKSLSRVRPLATPWTAYETSKIRWRDGDWPAGRSGRITLNQKVFAEMSLELRVEWLILRIWN